MVTTIATENLVIVDVNTLYKSEEMFASIDEKYVRFFASARGQTLSIDIDREETKALCEAILKKLQ